MNDLIDFFKRKSKKHGRGPVKTIATTKGPAVTTSTYFIKRTIPLCVIAGSPYNTQGPAVTHSEQPANTNNTRDRS